MKVRFRKQVVIGFIPGWVSKLIVHNQWDASVLNMQAAILANGCYPAPLMNTLRKVRITVEEVR